MRQRDHPQNGIFCPDLASSEFLPIRDRLAHAFLEHKTDLDVPLFDDVDAITHLLVDRAGIALCNRPWLARYRWFAEIIDDLTEQRLDKRLDAYTISLS
ncbi:hypothetical protein [Reyranella sp.]|uniref:hypothetical protein n=1 Tax=Reyranella sp. TaxID=1929291 RepID=UPI0037845A57